MTCATSLPPRLVGVVAWALAGLMVAGASTPRLRAPGRERVVRSGVVRASTLRTDDCRGWVAPDTCHDPHTAADALQMSRRGGADVVGGVVTTLAPGLAWSFAAPALVAATDREVPARRLTRGLARASAGRAPPLA